MDPQRLFGPITTRNVRIDQFDTFILNNIPYAEVPPESVNWGAVDYDGPDARGIRGAKPALQWHFGGVPYPISKAIRIGYTYVRRWDGSNERINTSIYLGFQGALDKYIFSQPIPYVVNPTPTYDQRVNSLGTYGGFSTHSWASDPGVLASEAQALITRSLKFQPRNLNNFDELMNEELTDAVANRLRHGDTVVSVDFDGPAQDYHSHRPFEYTFATLQNDREKYSQVLFWYFGGRPFRLTKAMRIPLDDMDGASAVLSAARARSAMSERLSHAQARVREVAAEPRAAEPQTVEALKQLTDLHEEDKGLQSSLALGGTALFLGYAGPDPGG